MFYDQVLDMLGTRNCLWCHKVFTHYDFASYQEAR